VTPLRIEPMREADLDAVLAIDLASFHASGDDEARPIDATSPRVVRAQQLREELARTWARLRVARDPAGPVLGYLLFWHVTDELHLLNVAVEPSARRRGIGRALVEDLVAYGREHAAQRVLLEVRASNEPAIRMYEQLRFSRFNLRKGYYPDGEDAVEMMLELA
jgi:ribosomal-protein-alanine N-acetyltransferase